jgi:UDP-N-acetylmuramate dehydrogenase
MTLAVTEDASLAGLNSFRVEARARRLAVLSQREDLSHAAELLRAQSESLILGSGSNILFTRDFDGTVLQVSLKGREILNEQVSPTQEDTVLVRAEAGESWHDFVMWTVEQGLSGVENLALIPGSVGAAPVQNIGAYGVELKDVLHSVEALSLQDGRIHRLTPEQCGLGYRHSVFRRQSDRAKWLIVSVCFTLSRRPSPKIHYIDLAKEFAGSSRSAGSIQSPSTADVAEAVIRIRRRKLPDPDHLGNAGSFFRNPVLELSQAQTLIGKFPDLPNWPDPDFPDRIKIAAGWLIERCGWKGKREGDAGVHENHALVLVNHGQARGAQIARLAKAIQESVADRFDIWLEPEVVLV